MRLRHAQLLAIRDEAAHHGPRRMAAFFPTLCKVAADTSQTLCYVLHTKCSVPNPHCLLPCCAPSRRCCSSIRVAPLRILPKLASPHSLRTISLLLPFFSYSKKRPTRPPLVLGRLFLPRDRATSCHSPGCRGAPGSSPSPCSWLHYRTRQQPSVPATFPPSHRWDARQQDNRASLML